ncbi:MAG: SGNH/GDSL hydrolase family protein, partial [Opitutaceae bacterium]
AGAQSGSAPELFQDGDRWCAIGDSITHTGSYHEWVQLFYLTRYPDRAVTAFNCGISGDTTAGALRRLDWDVLTKRPTVSSVMFGMNDVDRRLYGDTAGDANLEQTRRERIDAYRANLTNLAGLLQKSGSRVILLTPSIFDQTAEGERPKQTGVNDALAECAAIVRELAEQSGASLVDVHALMDRITREQQAKSAAFTLVGPDRAHPGAPGHFIMAYAFLKAQQAAPFVARLYINLESDEVLADNGTAEDVRKQQDGGLLFTWGARALPFPVDPEIQPALSFVPFTQEFNQEVLQVVGLQRGRYELRVDDSSAGIFTAEQFAAGINLAAIANTPQYVQALDVLRLVKARAELVSDNLRRIAQVEFRVAPDLPRPLTLEQVQPLVNERLSSLEPGAANASFRRALELYPQRKESETEALGSADRLARLARLTAQPRSHIYLIRAVR